MTGKHRWFPKFVSGLWLVPYDFGESPFFQFEGFDGIQNPEWWHYNESAPKRFGCVGNLSFHWFPFSNSQKCSMIHSFFHFLTRCLHFRFCFPKESAWNPNVFTCGTTRWVKWEASKKPAISFVVRCMFWRNMDSPKNSTIHKYCFRICGCGTRWQAMSSYVLPWMMRISWRFWSLTVDRNGVRVVFLCVFETIEVCWKAGRI